MFLFSCILQLQLTRKMGKSIHKRGQKLSILPKTGGKHLFIAFSGSCPPPSPLPQMSKNQWKRHCRQAHSNSKCRQAHSNSKCRQAHSNSKYRQAHSNSKCRQAHSNSKCRQAHSNSKSKVWGQTFIYSLQWELSSSLPLPLMSKNQWKRHRRQAHSNSKCRQAHSNSKSKVCCETSCAVLSRCFTDYTCARESAFFV